MGMAKPIKAGFLLSVLIISAGCAVPTKLSTPSGRPEIRINGVSKDQISNKIISAMETRGFLLQQSSPYSLVFGRAMEDNMTAKLLYGSRNSPTPEYRIQYTLAEDSDQMHILCSLWIVSNPGTPFERRQAMNNTKDAQDMQEALDNLKSSLE